MTKSKLRQKLNLSEAVEDYLKAIYLIREEESTDNTPTVLVTTNALAARLEVAPGSVTGMIKKLVEHHLVRHLPYHGVELTDIGEHLALELVRHHRLIELYLTHVVGFSWDEVHEQADALEHAISEEFEDKIATLLGDPTIDPHGDPIPTKEGKLQLTPMATLAEYCTDVNAALVITRVMTQEKDRLRYLAQIGLIPGTEVTLLQCEPFGGPITLRTAGATGVTCQIGPEIARLIVVTPIGAIT